MFDLHFEGVTSLALFEARIPAIIDIFSNVDGNTSGEWKDATQIPRRAYLCKQQAMTHYILSQDIMSHVFFLSVCTETCDSFK